MAGTLRYACVLVFTLFNLLSSTHAEVYKQPQQLHLSYGDSPSEMVVTWVTFNMTEDSVVEYGSRGLDSKARGVQDTFVDDGAEKRVLYIHRVKITGLTPGQGYVYHAGCIDGWSSLYTFRAMRPGQNWSPRFAVYGDLGNKQLKGQSMGYIQEETQKGRFDAILHVGDFAYNMDTDNARVGDAFMDQIETIAGYIPYMATPGNHEQAYNFSNYKARFTMPKAGGDGQNLWYSYDMGPIHFVTFSSEVYYFQNWGKFLIEEQYKWLENDLQKANQPENRAARPWIISMCHRPMYCSNSVDAEHCVSKDNLIRVGIDGHGIEDLLYRYGVDLHYQAHEHSYERFWPTYNFTVCNGSQAEPCTNPRAPVHMIVGSAGCQEGRDPFMRHAFPWSANHSPDYGYMHMSVYNHTHLYTEEVSAELGGKVIDKMWLIKEKHGMDVYDCHKQQAPPVGDLSKYPKVWAEHSSNRRMSQDD